MRKLIAIVLLLGINALAMAADPPANEATVRKLLDVMEARSMLDTMGKQMDQYMEAGMRQALQNRTPTPQQQQVMDATRKRMAKVMQEMLDWSVFEPIFLKIYRDNFTQSEVDGMIAFYQSPPGQALIKKMPATMQSTMVEVQKIMPAMMQKLQDAIRESARELETTDKPQPAK